MERLDRRLGWFCACVLGAVLGACTTTPPLPTAAPAPAPIAPAPGAPAMPSAPPSEQAPAWSHALQRMTQSLQEAALREGGVAIDRTADDQLLVCVALRAGFDAREPSPRLRRFLDTFAAQLRSNPSLVTSLAENVPTRPAQPIVPQPRARAARRYLLDRGVQAGRLSIVLEGTHTGGMQFVRVGEGPCLELLVTTDEG